MKRTNPQKGRAHDPGFEPISWDGDYKIISDKFRETRAKGLPDEFGFPRLAASFEDGGKPTQYMGTFPVFLSAWGPSNLGYGAGQGVKCYHSEHVYVELWHRALNVSPDTPHTNYIINCGNNVEASAFGARPMPATKAPNISRWSHTSQSPERFPPNGSRLSRRHTPHSYSA